MRKHFKRNIKNKVSSFLFGVRAKGEKLVFEESKMKTVYPKDRPDFFEWAKEYRVGCAYKNKPVYY